MPTRRTLPLDAVARSASEVAAVLGARIDQGYDVVARVPSCTLMLKFGWPLIVPGNSAVETSTSAIGYIAASQRRLTSEDILRVAEYAAVRRDKRGRIAAIKRLRHIERWVPSRPFISRTTTRRGSGSKRYHPSRRAAAQLEDELSAYNPLIPQGSELIATIMFEIDEPERRTTVLSRLGGKENQTFLDVAGERIHGQPDPTRKSASAEGKVSAVQFLKFPFTRDQIIRFEMPGLQVVVGFDHSNYAHITVLPEPVRAALSEDFD